MSMFDLTSETAFGLSRVEPDERAVSALLKQPALSYIRDLRDTMEQDPNFLTFHDRSVSLKVQSLLSRQGIFWDTDVFEMQFPKVVIEAVARLRDTEGKE
jgi:hypothetical protein